MRPAGRFFFGCGMVSASLSEKNGVTSVILLPRKTVISLAAMVMKQGMVPCKLLATEIIRHHQLNIISKFFGLQHDRCDTEFY